MTLFLALNLALGFPTGAYPECGPDNPDGCPPDLDERWELISWIPAGSVDSVRPEELALGSGVSADRAYRYTTGRFDVAIAIIDSGIEWDDSKLREKVRISPGELPWPLDESGSEVVGGDADGNGLFNVDDYQWDPRVDITDGEDRADDKLDASDLLAAFSDGVDDDGNGYVDDIAGWDFFENDNDPYARTQGLNFADHGTGVMRTAAGAADDGSGLGTCPNCSVVPLRIGEAFITDGDRIAAALNYVAENDIAVAGMAVGALSHGAHTKAAVLAADAAGTVLVGVAGDENSYHHNWPSTEDPILYVRSIRGNNQNEDDGTDTYFATWNCNNWGPRLDLVAPNAACGTGSVAMISGGAGLLVSAGLDHGTPLSPDEVKALLRTTADDVNISDADTATYKLWPSHEGWDPFFGYGRMNLGAAVQAVYTDQLPPVASLIGPGWFSHLDPRAPTPITGFVRGDYGGVARWVLEVGEGEDPTSWAILAEGTEPASGTLATLEPTAWGHHVFGDLGTEKVHQRMSRAHEPMVHLRLTVTDDSGRQTADRMGLWLMRDPDTKPGFPLDLGGSLEAAPLLADLDADGVFEVIAVSSEGTLHALYGDATPVPGFPVTLPSGVLSGPAVGDLDGDGAPEIVLATLGGQLVAVDTSGTVIPGFPVQMVGRSNDERGESTAWDNGFMSTPALGDADGDGDLEIVVGGLDQRLYVVDETGADLPGFPLELCQLPEGCAEYGARIVASPALGDLDGDGDLDCAIGSNELPIGAAGPLYLVDLSTGEQLPGSPLAREGLLNESLLPVIGEGHPSSVSLADLDGDGDLEISSNPMLGNNGLIHHDGSDFLPLSYTDDGAGPSTNFSGGAFLSVVTAPAFGDLTGDGVPDPVIGGAGVDWLVSLVIANVVEYQHAVGAWDGVTGEALPGWPRQIDDVSFLVAPAIVDIDGDGDRDVLYPSGGHFLYAWDASGRLAEGWPKFTGGWSISGPSVGDIDGDGWHDVVLTTREGDLFAWTSSGPADQTPAWAGNRHDTQNTGNVHTPLPRQAGPVLLDEKSGCCRGKNKSRGDTAWLLLAPLWWLRRRTSPGR